jgi:hypothetical protein
MNKPSKGELGSDVVTDLNKVGVDSDLPASLQGKTLAQAIASVFQLANDIKTKWANAITSKGVTASSTETSDSLATKTGQIRTPSGNATAQDLLAGKTASTTAGDITGGMPNRTSGATALSASTDGAGKVYLVPPIGYFDGVASVNANDPNFVASNFKKNVTAFGLTGTLPENPFKKVDISLLMSVSYGGNPHRYYLPDGTWYTFEINTTNKTLSKNLRNSGGTIISSVVIVTNADFANDARVIPYSDNKLFVAPNSLSSTFNKVIDFNGNVLKDYSTNTSPFDTIAIYDNWGRKILQNPNIYTYDANGNLTLQGTTSQAVGNSWYWDFRRYLSSQVLVNFGGNDNNSIGILTDTIANSVQWGIYDLMNNLSMYNR